MFRRIKTNSGEKLQELSIKQREMLLAYRRDVTDRKVYLEEKVTWRELLQESILPEIKSCKRYVLEG